jgi:hypothetical protein
MSSLTKNEQSRAYVLIVNGGKRRRMLMWMMLMPKRQFHIYKSRANSKKTKKTPKKMLSTSPSPALG